MSSESESGKGTSLAGVCLVGAFMAEEAGVLTSSCFVAFDSPLLAGVLAGWFLGVDVAVGLIGLDGVLTATFSLSVDPLERFFALPVALPVLLVEPLDGVTVEVLLLGTGSFTFPLLGVCRNAKRRGSFTCDGFCDHEIMDDISRTIAKCFT